LMDVDLAAMVSKPVLREWVPILLRSTFKSILWFFNEVLFF
jgi:hypothetical protein